MLYYIECRFKSLTQPQEWGHVFGDGQTFSLQEVQEFQRDLGPDDWDNGMEYRARLIEDCANTGHDPIVVIHPPHGLAENNIECERGPGPFGFVRQTLTRLFMSQGV